MISVFCQRVCDPKVLKICSTRTPSMCLLIFIKLRAYCTRERRFKFKIFKIRVLVVYVAMKQ